MKRNKTINFGWGFPVSSLSSPCQYCVVGLRYDEYATEKSNRGHGHDHGGVVVGSDESDEFFLQIGKKLRKHTIVGRWCWYSSLSSRSRFTAGFKPTGRTFDG
jgi:hypothetical protein